MFSLSQAAELIPNTRIGRIGGGADLRFDRVATDSRSVQPGDLFVALQGERFDAHDFLFEAAMRGAVAMLVSRCPTDQRLLDWPILQVPNTRVALGALARGWRRQFALPLIVVTGSNGKTTVKEMIASIFAAAVGKEACFATRGNLNNDIGVPLTLLRLNAAHQLAVVEFGMNHPGETAVLANITQPTIALINNAQREHQEFMTTVEAVAVEHAQVMDALPHDGVAVFPADDAYTPIWRAAAVARDLRIFDFALLNEAVSTHSMRAVIRGTLRSYPPMLPMLHIETPTGALALTLRVLGRHNAHNALAAAAAACAAGVALDAIKRGLEVFESITGRLQIKRSEVLAGTTVIDDTYNANPDSMRAAIDVLATFDAPRILVIGDMGEVGDDSADLHREMGEYARERHIDALFALGAASCEACSAYGRGAQHFDSAQALISQLLIPMDTDTDTDTATANATILVKGSRFMRMERVVNALINPSLSIRSG